MEDFRQFFKGVKAGLSCVDAPSDTGFFPCPAPSVGSSAVVCPACLMRRTDDCRWPAWRCADRVQIAFARSEAPRKPAGFPDPVSMTVCPCTVLGFPRVSGVARLRSRFRSGS